MRSVPAALAALAALVLAAFLASPQPAHAGKTLAPRAKPSATVDAARLGVLAEGVGVPPGTEVPALSLTSVDGSAVQLAEVTPGASAQLLVFYRGGWCPYCNGQLRDLAGIHEQLASQGVQLVAISGDAPDKAALSAATWELPFPVLADLDLSAHRAFGVLTRPSEGTLTKYRTWGLDVREDGHMAVPSLFLVVDGEVRWAHADPDYKTRPSPEQLLEVLPTVLPPQVAPPASAASPEPSAP